MKLAFLLLLATTVFSAAIPVHEKRVYLSSGSAAMLREVKRDIAMERIKFGERTLAAGLAGRGMNTHLKRSAEPLSDSPALQKRYELMPGQMETTD